MRDHRGKLHVMAPCDELDAGIDGPPREPLPARDSDILRSSMLALEILFDLQPWADLIFKRPLHIGARNKPNPAFTSSWPAK